MTKVSFQTYTAASNGNRPLEQAVAEVKREIDVRRRMYDQWVADGKFAHCDGVDRLERMLSALTYLIKLQEMNVTNIGDLAELSTVQ